MSIYPAKLLIILGIIGLFTPGCNVLKFVPKGKTLVDANFIKVEGDEKIDNLKDQILLVPNRKMLLVVKFNLWSYYFGKKIFPNDSIKGKLKIKTKKLFTEIIGEKPVYLDSVMLNKSQKNLKQYLYQKGYFNAKVSYKVTSVLKRSYITYTIIPGQAQKINSIVYNGSDRLLDKVANDLAINTTLSVGDKVDYERLSGERDRITTDFRNNGFYYFNKAFIDIVVDTSLHNQNCNVFFNISNPGDLRNARPQSVAKVLVIMNFNERQAGNQNYTVVYKTIDYQFNGYNIKPNIINRSIILKPNDLFSQRNLEATYKKLIGLGLFKSVNINIEPNPKDTLNKINVTIYLTPSSKHDFVFEPQAITSDKQTNLSSNNNARNYGIAASTTLSNKNVFRNAEDFNIRYRTAFENQFGTVGNSVTILGKDVNVGSYESNLTFELLFPKLVFLRRLDTIPFLQQNRTSINLNLLTEVNSNYTRQSVPLNYTWQTIYTTKKKQAFIIYYSPIQLSFNRATIEDQFLAKFTPAEQIRLNRTFRDYIIPSQKAGLIYTNQSKSPDNFWYFRGNIFELSGNVMDLIITKIQTVDSTDKLFLGRPYFQYFRSDLDLVKTRRLSKNKYMVYRINVGYARPYGNSTIIPFERQFFVGGSNSLRAWTPRVLGPGTYNNKSAVQIDKTGDIMIVTNVEYRFAIAPGSLNGAFFLDAGNIWEVSKSAPKDAKLQLKFYEQMALNTGFGLRLDLSFLILRFDLGVPIHDPSEPENERMVIKKFKNFAWVKDRCQPLIAVGYPF